MKYNIIIAKLRAELVSKYPVLYNLDKEQRFLICDVESIQTGTSLFIY